MLHRFEPLGEEALPASLSSFDTLGRKCFLEVLHMVGGRELTDRKWLCKQQVAEPVLEIAIWPSKGRRREKSYQLLSSLSSVFLWPGAFVITGLPSWLSGKRLL